MSNSETKHPGENTPLLQEDKEKEISEDADKMDKTTAKSDNADQERGTDESAAAAAAAAEKKPVKKNRPLLAAGFVTISIIMQNLN